MTARLNRFEQGPRDDSHGPSPREREILERSDDGMSIEAIAAELGLAATYVRQTITLLAITDHEHNRWRQTAAMSNRAFLRAVAAAEGSFA